MKKREHLHTVSRNGNWCGHCGNGMAIPQKTKKRTTIWSINFTPGYISEEDENNNLKRSMNPDGQSSIFTIAKIWKQSVSTSRWMEKNVEHTHDGILLRYRKKNEILPCATTWMDLEGIILSGISQTEKDKCYMLSIICGFYKIKKTSEYNKKERLTVIENN